MKYDRLWERLLEYLDTWAVAREVPGGIAVTFETSTGVTRTVEVRVTPPAWDDYVSTIFGTGDPRATSLERQLRATTAPYLVYDTYDWVPSATRQPPDDGVGPVE